MQISGGKAIWAKGKANESMTAIFRQQRANGSRAGQGIGG